MVDPDTPTDYIEELSSGCVVRQVITTYKIDTDKLKAYRLKHNQLPQGVNEIETEGRASMTLNKKALKTEDK